MTPSQKTRKPKSHPKRAPRDCYDRHSYDRAIKRACTLGEIPKWHPNQLRHACGTKLRKLFGVEAAQLYLGHEKMSTTEIYAERDFDLIAKIASKVG